MKRSSGDKKGSLRIGEVATLADVNVQTLRYYERRGLLEEPVRRISGYRAYPPGAVQLIRFVKQAQGLGFSLDEIEEMLHIRKTQGNICARVRSTALAKIADIEQRIRTLRMIKASLEKMLHSCPGEIASDQCTIMESALKENSVEPSSRLPRRTKLAGTPARAPGSGQATRIRTANRDSIGDN
jgi:DNA-binding transcriptional MerR regulator